KVITDFGASSDAYSVVLQPDGKIVAAGYRITGSNTDFALARYNPNGTLDSDFDADGKVVTDFGMEAFDNARSVVVQPDGRIVAAGTTVNSEANFNFALARYNPDGSLDTSFDFDGKAVTDFAGADEALGVLLQPDGKVVAGGSTFSGGGL